jgi:hypothetical protein
MRRLLLLIAVLAGVVALSTPAWAEPPEHFVQITKNGTVTMPLLLPCPTPATSIDLVFNAQVHAVFTDTTFHLTQTQTGTFTSRLTPGGAVVATGHFTTTMNQEFPGFPKASVTSVINANGTTSDGTHLTIHILEHTTVTPDGQVAVTFDRVDC